MKSAMEQTASSLVKGISNFSDHQKWFEFHNRYGPMIRKVLQNKGLRPDELDDAVQETYLSMLSTIERFQYDRQKGKFRSWVSKITDRAASAHRRKQVQSQVDAQELARHRSQDGDPEQAEEERMQICLELARSRIDERTWLPFYLRVVEEAPMADVERITKLNRNAIYQSVHRVKQCLKELLDQFDRARRED
ncbi:MAG: sigma-70 family RNA polymerase sigma factor [Planctomycetota bacterium]|nr:sigma-70 family RNA polymerase sigma factor [Planctomycetota bacterium]